MWFASGSREVLRDGEVWDNGTGEQARDRACQRASDCSAHAHTTKRTRLLENIRVRPYRTRAALLCMPRIAKGRERPECVPGRSCTDCYRKAIPSR